MPTSRRRLQITENRELAAAPPDEANRQKLLGELVDHFRKPEAAPWDSEALRKGKRHAWPIH